MQQLGGTNRILGVVGKYQSAGLRLGIVELHNARYNPDLGIVAVLALLRGLLPAWYFDGESGSRLNVYETHPLCQFRKL